MKKQSQLSRRQAIARINTSLSGFKLKLGLKLGFGLGCTAANLSLSPNLQAATLKPGQCLIGACDWTMGYRADPAAITIASKIGLDGVQVDLGDIKKGLPASQQMNLDKYRKRMKETGVKVPALAIGNMNQRPFKSEANAPAWTLVGMKTAQQLGAKVLLLPFFGKGDIQNDKAGFEATIKRLQLLAPHAKYHGITLGLETWLSADKHIEIMDRVNSPYVKVYYDTGNMKKKGYDIYKEIRQLKSHICEFHAKDYKDVFGKGDVDFPKVRKAMVDIGYSGWLIMEGPKAPLGKVATCEANAKYLKQIFKAS